MAAALPNDAFGAYAIPDRVAVLADGSAIVQAGRGGLFHVVGRRVTTIWAPYTTCGDYQRPHDATIIGSFANAAVVYRSSGMIYGVRPDGSVAFHWPMRAKARFGRDLSVEQGSDGVAWFVDWNDPTKPNAVMYAYFPKTQTKIALAPPDRAWRMFRGANGRVYVTAWDGLFELRVRPNVHAQLVHGRNSISTRALESDYLSEIQGVGPDGSLWAATATEIVHQYPSGKRVVVRLTRSNGGGSTQMQLTVAPDGSAWTDYSKPVRITSGDRLEVIEQPPNEGWGGISPSFGPDSSPWVILTNATDMPTEGVVHFTLSPQARSTPTAAIFPNAVSTSHSKGACNPPLPR